MLMKKLFTLFVSLWMAIASLFAANISANTVIYFDASAYTNIQTSIASGKTLQMLLGHSTWSQGYKMTAVDGYDNIYSVKMPKWDGCTQLAFCTVDSEWGGEGSSVTSRLNWTYEKTAVHSISSNMSGNVGFAGNPLTRTNNYTLPVKAPKITVAAAPQFATTTVGETSNATLKYTLENATEATATIEGEGFSISAQEVGSVTIVFAPEAEGDYTGTLTITSGEVKETVALAAKAVAAEAPKVPEFLNVTTPVFAEIIEGEVTTAEVTYELVNATEATASVDGEFFSIKEQELGKVIIEFASEEAGVFEGTLTLTSGETVKEITFTATAKKAPVIVTISFVNPDWTEAAIWAWVEGGENLTGGTWPGKAMTKDETTGVFSYALTIPEDGVYSFIINNNNKGTQSVNMAGVTESTCYNLGAKSGDKYNLVVAENCDYTPAPEPEPIDPYVAIRGTMTDWDMAKDIKMTYNADAANGPEWYFTAFEVPADGKFKVVSVDAKGAVTWYGSDKVDLQEGLTNAGKGDGDIDLGAGTYDIYFKVNEGRMWIQKYVEPTPEPEPLPIVITFEDEVEFPKTYVGETTNDIINFTIENAPEDAEVNITVTGDEAFSIAEIQDGYVVLAFAPQAEGEYAGVLTITVGEVSESLEFTAVASPVEPGPEPDPVPALTVSAEAVAFDELTLGEEPVSATQTITYTVENSEEAVVLALESDVFTAEDAEGTITITFAPTSEGEYTAELTLTLGDIVKTVAISGAAKAAAVEPEPDPTPEYPKTITVKVACAWEACNIWAWYADGSGNVYTEWPGEAMTKGEDGFYAIDMTIESPVYFKVNAGLGKTESENYMTELSESTCFNMNGLALVVNEDCEYEEPIEIEPYYGIRGLVSWEMADDIKLTEDADKAEWYITNVEVDGTQEFKVVYVDKTGAATWYGSEAVELQVGVVNNGTDNIILAAGKYDIYFKANDGMMWIQFSAETPTDVEDAAAELIYAVDGTIIAPAPFAIIDLAGKDVTNANGSLQGAYIVKTQNSVTKVLVK